ncbi:MAG: cphA [Massilia sp.]|nr:cphA [Massilia sp.]
MCRPDVTIHEKRFLRGPNLHSATPCLMILLEGGPAVTDGIRTRLLAMLPGLAPLSAPSGAQLVDGTLLLEWVEPLVMELQRLAGAPGQFSRTLMVPARPHARRVICAYACEPVAGAALTAALDLLGALSGAQAHDSAQDIDAVIAALREVAEDHAIGTSTDAVLAAAHRRGIPSIRLQEDANLFQLGWGARQRRLQATITGATSSIAASIASDKQLTKTLLEQAGVPVPAGSTVTSVEEAQRAALRLGGLVAVKPLDANQGKGVTTMCAGPDEVARAYGHARRYSRQVIVERHFAGRDYRVLVTGKKVAAASWRRPPHVIADGVSTIRELVELENRNPARGDGHTNILTKIPLDDIAEGVLARQGYGWDAVPPAGMTLELRGNANLSTGGTAEDVTDLLPEETRATCVRAARTVGLDVAGIDIVCEDISRTMREQNGGIIEVNAAPGIRMHQYPSRGKARDAGDAIVEALFGASDGRIPLVAVTGTNGKTTTSLLIAHCAREAGLATGVTTTEGIYIDGQLTAAGDCTGYHSARSILSSPDVEFAVLETARGGILKRGLGFDRCDVAVVLNVSVDHLGLDGIETVGELARVKAVVAQRASGAVVLNAEDEHCVAMAARLADGVEVIYFSLDADNPVLLRHLQRGGRGVYLQDTALVLADSKRHQALLDVHAMPVSLGGCSRFNIANALAAAAALAAAGFGRPEIAAGLSSFVSDNKHNPLRSNVFDVDGVTVIVDYAHNAAAYAAVAETARAMTRGRVVGVVATPGDRRDVDIVNMGRVCGAGFDELVVFEVLNRGRPDGQTAALLARGARRTRMERRHVRVELDLYEALRRGLALCRRGDVLVYASATSVLDLAEALRPTRSEIAQRIEADAI